MQPVPSNVVLLVEDEPHILFLLSEYLAGEGYQVLQADSAARAFEILATKPRLDLLISDYRLPDGVSGVMIAEPALMTASAASSRTRSVATTMDARGLARSAVAGWSPISITSCAWTTLTLGGWPLPYAAISRSRRAESPTRMTSSVLDDA